MSGAELVSRQVGEKSLFRKTGRRIIVQLDRLSEKRGVAYLIYFASTIFFFGIILLPSLLGILLKIDTVQDVLSNPEMLERSVSSIFLSIIMAIIVSVVDVIAGLPLVWILVKRKYRWMTLVDSLADLPMIIPTVILGYSTLLI